MKGSCYSSRLWILIADGRHADPVARVPVENCKGQVPCTPFPGTRQHRPCLFPWCFSPWTLVASAGERADVQ